MSNDELSVEIAHLKQDVQNLKKEMQEITVRTTTNTQDVLLLNLKLDKLDAKLCTLESQIVPKLSEITTNTAQLKLWSSIGWKIITPLISCGIGGLCAMLVYLIRTMS